MAPMASGIADRKQDGFLLIARCLEGFVTPSMPVNWVIFMLQKIGAGFSVEMVSAHLVLAPDQTICWIDFLLWVDREPEQPETRGGLKFLSGKDKP